MITETKEKEENELHDEVLNEIPGKLVLAVDEEGRDAADWRKDYLKQPECMLHIRTVDDQERIMVIKEDGSALCSAPGEYAQHDMFHVFKTVKGAKYVFEEDPVEGESAIIARINYMSRIHYEKERRKYEAEMERRENAFIENFFRHFGFTGDN